LWSLAVEEQYYLIFPYFILFFNKKKHVNLLFVMIFLGLLSRIYFYTIQSHIIKENNYMINEVNTISVLDCFGIGGLLAFLYHYNINLLKKILYNNYMTLATLCFYMLLLYLSYISTFTYDNIYYVVFRTLFASIFSFYLIGNSIIYSGNKINILLENKIIVYLGSISYGIYLYHNLVYNYFHFDGNTIWGYLSNNFSYINSLNSKLIILKFSINFLILIGIASFSWFYIEKPISKFKTRI